MEDQIWADLDQYFEETRKKEEEEPEGGPKKKNVNHDSCACGNEEYWYEDRKQGHTVCTECGITMNGPIIDRGQEWRDYHHANAGEHHDGHSGGGGGARTNDPVNPFLPQSGLGTNIGAGYGSKGNSGGKGGGGGGVNYDRLRNMQYWNTMPYIERVLWVVIQRLNQLQTHQGITIPNFVIQDTTRLYRDIAANQKKHRKIFRGHLREGIIAACLYHTLASHGIPWTTKEVCNAVGVSLHDMAKCCHTLHKIMLILKKHNINTINTNTINTNSPNPNPNSNTKNDEGPPRKPCTVPSELAFRYACKMGLPYKVSLVIQKIVDVVDSQHFLPCACPSTLAAGTIRMVTEEMGVDVPVADIAEICGLSKATLSKTHKQLLQFHDRILEIAAT